MFGFSLQKLLVLAAVIAAVWYGFKLVGRLQDQRQAERRQEGGKARRRSSSGRSNAEPTKSEAEDMVECTVCQAYVPARGATNCGRADCPY